MNKLEFIMGMTLKKRPHNFVKSPEIVNRM